MESMDAILVAKLMARVLANDYDPDLDAYQVVPGAETGVPASAFALIERATGRQWAISGSLLSEPPQVAETTR